MNVTDPQARARHTADLQLRIEEGLRDAKTRAERRAAVAEARNETKPLSVSPRVSD